VSKTINLANSATEADVSYAFHLAWERGCKGITVYRDGCRDHQVLVAGTAPQLSKDDKPVKKAVRRRVPTNGQRTGVTLTRPTAYGSVHVTINEHPEDRQPFEVFVRIGKGGSEVNAWTEAFGRTASYLLSLPGEPAPLTRLASLAEQLSGIGGGESVGLGPDRTSSAADAIAKTLQLYLEQRSDTTPAQQEQARSVRMDICPSCHQATLTYEQSCGLCKNCGFSKC
jgi:ribonucleoside-diphosphate reductase alpha chain